MNNQELDGTRDRFIEVFKKFRSWNMPILALGIEAVLLNRRSSPIDYRHLPETVTSYTEKLRDLAQTQPELARLFFILQNMGREDVNNLMGKAKQAKDRALADFFLALFSEDASQETAINITDVLAGDIPLYWMRRAQKNELLRELLNFLRRQRSCEPAQLAPH